MSMIVTVVLWVLVVVLVVVGIAGLVLPALPGGPLLFGGLLLAAWLEDFAYVGPWTLLMLGILAASTYAVDLAAGALGAKHFGATRAAVVGALIGAGVGIFFGLPGILLGPFCGALLGELLADRTLRQAGVAGAGASIGLLFGIAAKVALAFTMVAIFILMRVWGGLG